MYCNIFAIAAAKIAPGSPAEAALATINDTLAAVAAASVAESMPDGSVSQLDGDNEHSIHLLVLYCKTIFLPIHFLELLKVPGGHLSIHCPSRTNLSWSHKLQVVAFEHSIQKGFTVEHSILFNFKLFNFLPKQVFELL